MKRRIKPLPENSPRCSLPMRRFAFRGKTQTLVYGIHTCMGLGARLAHA